MNKDDRPAGKPASGGRREWPPRICGRCGESYVPTSAGQKYCGKQKVRGTCAFIRVREDMRAKWANPETYPHISRRTRDFQLKRDYGITIEEYERLVVIQNGRCLICCKAQKLGVDHDHRTGEIRGLLCRSCNQGIGIFEDSPTLLFNAIAYLEKNMSNEKSDDLKGKTVSEGQGRLLAEPTHQDPGIRVFAEPRGMAQAGISYGDRQAAIEKQEKLADNNSGELQSLKEVVAFLYEKA